MSVFFLSLLKLSYDELNDHSSSGDQHNVGTSSWILSRVFFVCGKNREMRVTSVDKQAKVSLAKVSLA